MVWTFQHQWSAGELVSDVTGAAEMKIDNHKEGMETCAAETPEDIPGVTSVLWKTLLFLFDSCGE